MTFCMRTCRDGSFSSGIWKYTVGRNCDCVGGVCDHATAAIMPDARIVADTISLFMGHLPGYAHLVQQVHAHRVSVAAQRRNIDPRSPPLDRSPLRARPRSAETPRR